MVIAFQVFAILGIFAGGLIFFYGLALFNSYINSAKLLKVNTDDSSKEDKDGLNETVDSANESNLKVEPNQENQVEDTQENTAFDENNSEIIESRKKEFTPLPYFLLFEGLMLFIFNSLMFILKFYYPKMMEFYVLLPINIGFILLSIFIDALVMMRKSDNNDEIKIDNSIDKTE